MLLSIVTGTYNRRSHLIQMVVSARRNIPIGIPYEFVIVDGGSTDGTQAWCKDQPDIKLIEQGKLLGAIRAFCDGAKAASGDYVLLANDDVTFLPGSILPAIVYLEQTPLCGGVAFADDRPAPGYAGGFKIQTITVRMDSGKDMSVPYAQVGLFRRWLGDAVGWWGADDPQFAGHTYGGDNYLSARIWEAGYTIDPVDLCKVNDHMPADDLRERNSEQEQRNPGWYYKRYPAPPIIGSQKVQAPTQRERLRILYLPIYEPGHGKYKHGLRDALAKVALVFELDYLNQKYDLPALVEVWQPHLLLMQAHSATSLPLEKLVAARKAKPDMLVVNWNGDVHNVGLIDEAMLIYLLHVDMQLVVNESVLETYRQRGIEAAYWQIGYEPVDELPEVRPHDVVFLGTGYSEDRAVLANMLVNMQGVNVGLYGRGWKYPNGDTLYDFAAGRAIYQAAKIAIGDNQYSDQRAFVSNRLFEALASGVFLLHQTVPGLEDVTGIREGVHYIAWSDLRDLQDKIKYWLSPKHDKRRREIAEAGRVFVEANHSFDARVRELFEDILPMLEGERV